LDGEADLDRNNFITGSELGDYLQSNVVNYTMSRQHPQYGKIRNPNLDKGDFVFPVSSEETAVSASTAISATTATPPRTSVTHPRATVTTPRPTDIKSQRDISMMNREINVFTTMAFVEGGTYLMGAERGKRYERPLHYVKLDDFYISSHEITQKQWYEIMGTNPSAFKGCEDCPVNRVSWIDIQTFITRLNEKTGLNYRLPTEAEWEYAARGGNKSLDQKYSGSNDPKLVAWMKSNSRARTHPVGRKQPNELGIYDMSGNVLEWCSDWFGGTYYRIKGTHNNPTGPRKGVERVVRGGSYKYDASLIRTAARLDLREKSRYPDVGFRLVLTEK